MIMQGRTDRPAKREIRRPSVIRAHGFTFVEALVAMAILLGAMAIALTFFVDFGEAINTESSILATQQSCPDEPLRSRRPAGVRHEKERQ